MSVTFDPMPNSGKVACSVCGARGYDVDHKKSWKRAHLRGHAPCTKGCGVVLTVLLNGKPRAHARCPGKVRD